ncbi:transcriptional regulator [Amycolatopsis sp. PS_44_ISF1]|uniref:helix-turn-helix transcriptional regulator n=1 Tax=Amycolatopsis sp. PS_44_ISF1 TaxID=2974917 RepID=UPI0028DE7F55|nr:transcriptional regulator [Amycolatopsis sp. PS_44_ISF1]MDT8914184.1 transcriptional regulator [Amycolatopsis sp. PS_44_ISF1]
MYAFIRSARRPVSRDEAAASVGISRKLAAFHLDKLVDAGLLSARYEAVGGVRKVGRTPKVYEPAATDFTITIPPRRPDLLADILLGAVITEREGETARQATLRVAADRGAEFGTAERVDARPGRLGPERGLTFAETVLTRHGFEPSRDTPTRVGLRNCPFHPLAAQAPDLVCGVTRAFVTGVVAGLQVSHVEAALTAPRTGGCCVELRGTHPVSPGG